MMNVSHIQSTASSFVIANNHFQALRIVVVGKNSCERDVSSAIPVDQLPPSVKCALKSHIVQFLNEIDFAVRDAKLASKMQVAFAPPDFTY